MLTLGVLVVERGAIGSGAHDGDAQPDPIEPRLRRQVQRPPVVVTPGHVVGGARVLVACRGGSPLPKGPTPVLLECVRAYSAGAALAPAAFAASPGALAADLTRSAGRQVRTAKARRYGSRVHGGPGHANRRSGPTGLNHRGQGASVDVSIGKARTPPIYRRARSGFEGESK